MGFSSMKNWPWLRAISVEYTSRNSRQTNPTKRGHRMLLIVFRFRPRMKSLSRSRDAVNRRPSDQPIGQTWPAWVFRQIWTYREVRQLTFAFSDLWMDPSRFGGWAHLNTSKPSAVVSPFGSCVQAEPRWSGNPYLASTRDMKSPARSLVA